MQLEDTFWFLTRDRLIIFLWKRLKNFPNSFVWIDKNVKKLLKSDLKADKIFQVKFQLESIQLQISINEIDLYSSSG